MTFDDFNCSLDFLGSETDILQSSDLANDTITANTDDPFTSDEFAPAGRVVARVPDDYVLTNESDCGAVACANPEAQVDWYQGTPEGGACCSDVVHPDVADSGRQHNRIPSTRRPAEPGPSCRPTTTGPLNAVETSGGAIWTAKAHLLSSGRQCAARMPGLPRAQFERRQPGPRILAADQ